MYVAKQVLDAEHDHPAPAAYPYLNIATKVKFSYYKNNLSFSFNIGAYYFFKKKLFPWGRGEESLFWNPHANVNPAKGTLPFNFVQKKKGYMFSFSKNK